MASQPAAASQVAVAASWQQQPAQHALRCFTVPQDACAHASMTASSACEPASVLLFYT
jgi:hypothetical protein